MRSINVLSVTAVLFTLFATAAQAAGDSFSSSTSPANKIMLASTIGPIDAGIVGALEEVFTKKTGIVVEHIGAGTGNAIQMAETGKYDLLRTAILPQFSGREEAVINNRFKVGTNWWICDE